MFPPSGGSTGGLRSSWSISHHRGYCSRKSTVRSSHPSARVAGPLRLAGNLLLDCVPARLSPVTPIAPADVCHGPHCSLAGLRQPPRGTAPAAGPLGGLGRPSASDPWDVLCCFPSLGCPRCAPVCNGHGPSALVDRCVHPAVSCAGCPWPLGACSPVLAPGVFCVRCPWPLGSC